MCHHYPGADRRAAQSLISFSDIKLTPNFDDLWSTDYYPLRDVPILRINAEDDTWILERRSWGLLHKSWKPTAKIKTAKSFQRGKINARSETIHTTWPWKFAFSQRCVMLAAGFFEPQKQGGEGLYTLPNHSAIAIPGLWDRYQGDDGKGNPITIDSCVMLTCDANSLVAENRTGRMRQPVVLTDPEDITRYCSLEITEHQQLNNLFAPLPSGQMNHKHIPKSS